MENKSESLANIPKGNEQGITETESKLANPKNAKLTFEEAKALTQKKYAKIIELLGDN